jgi:VanZ family protein
LELWLQPAFSGASGTLAAFYTPGTRFRFRLGQSVADLVLEASTLSQQHPASIARIYINDVFRKDIPLFVTITSGARMAIYINSVLIRTSSQFRITRSNLTGQLVTGTAPVSDDDWSGQLRGLAIYDRELTTAEVVQHYRAWTADDRPAAMNFRHTIALYRFAERTGNVVHNEIRPGIDLYIPPRYMILHQLFLERPWDEFRPTSSYLQDVLVNIAGFIPLGFFFYACVSLEQSIGRPSLVTIGFGAAVSLTIEILQSFLPTRNSGTTDLFTNTLGTALGVLLFRSRFVHALYSTVLDRITEGLISMKNR